MWETLEPRQLLAVNLVDGILTVTGTAKSDVIRIVQRESRIDVTVNNKLDQFDPADVESYVVKGNRGDDRILISVGQIIFLGDSTADTNTPVLIDAGGGNDTVHSSRGSADTLLGGSGDDFLFTETFRANRLDGGAGNDTLRGGWSSEEFIGGDGNDTVDYSDHTFGVSVTLDDLANDGHRNVIFDTAGAPTGVDVTPIDYSSERDNVRSDIENVIGGSGDDNLTGNSLPNRLTGGGGNDLIVGGGSNDTLLGDDGDDTLVGGGGNDRLGGGPGDDVLFAGRAGNFTIA